MKKFNTKKVLKAVVLSVTTVALVLSNAQQALACTAFYVGSETTDDGCIYYGRSEDLQPEYPKVLSVMEAKDHEKGEMFTDTYGFSAEYPEHTLKYTYICDSPEAGETEEVPAYPEAGINEKGVSVSATVSTGYNDKAEAADPLNTESGVCEISMASLILQEATSAKNGVEILAGYIDKYGAGECNILTIADSKEVWYMEIVSGHQYVAIKMPADKVAIYPNVMMLDAVNINDKDVIASEGLISVPETAGFLVTATDEDGSINVAMTYGDGVGAHTSYRIWQGVNFLNAELASKINPVPQDLDSTHTFLPNAIEESADGPFSLLFNADRKLSLKDVMDIVKQRGAGTKYDSNADENIYPVSNKNQAECHFFQIRQDMPEEVATVEWLALSAAEFSVYIPNYGSLVNEWADTYNSTSMSYEKDKICWNFAEISAMCNANRESTAETVQEYFAKVQDQVISEQETIDENMVELANEGNNEGLGTYATATHAHLTDEVEQNASYVYNELKAYVDGGCEGEFTLNDEIITVEEEIEVPTIPDNQEGAKKFNKTLMIVAIIVLLAAAGVVVYLNKKKGTKTPQ